MSYIAWFLSFCIGFISLSEEILWVRIVSFIFQGTPHAFSMVLTAFLGGIALGAVLGKKLSQRGEISLAKIGILLLVAAVFLLYLPFAISKVNSLQLDKLWIFLLIFFSASLKGILFPLAHHLGSIPGKTLARSVSRVYFSNIVGSTLGPLVTGFILLDHFSSGVGLQLLGACCALVAVVFFVIAGQQSKKSVMYVGVLVGAITILILRVVYSQGNQLMQHLAVEEDGIHTLHMLVENRYGVVHTVSEGGHSDKVYGGNVYDGQTNIDLIDNGNAIDRAYLFYALHPAPKRVLVIGMSTGAWTRVLSAVPGVERIDVVEINPGYLKMVQSYPHLAPLLTDKKIHIHIDDGRRWLRRSHQQFDMIVMNTSFHWRANATNLLSVEMMELVKKSLSPRGIFTFNTTYSFDAFYTAAHVFPHAYMFRNFVYAADYDFRIQEQNVAERVKAFRLDGKTLVENTPEGNLAAEKLSKIRFTDINGIVAVSPRPLQIITDQNMITEFRFGRN